MRKMALILVVVGLLAGLVMGCQGRQYSLSAQSQKSGAIEKAAPNQSYVGPGPDIYQQLYDGSY